MCENCKVLEARAAELEDDVCELQKIRNELSEEIEKLKIENKKLQDALSFSAKESKDMEVSFYEIRILVEILAAIDFDELKSMDSVKYLIELMQERSA